jgi:hypothetical protein
MANPMDAFNFGGLEIDPFRRDPNILQQIRSNDPSLTSVNLNWHVTRHDDLNHLCEALRYNTTLTSLEFCCNSIGVKIEGAGYLVDLLQNKPLKSLNLNQNSLGFIEPSELTNILLRNTSLTSLVLSRNGFGIRHAEAIGLALQTNTTLKSLDLNSNDIGTEGATALITSLQHNTTLTSLDLSDNQLDPAVQQDLTTKILSARQAMRQDHQSLADLHNDDEGSLISTLPCDMCLINDIIGFANASISNCQVIWENKILWS